MIFDPKGLNFKPDTSRKASSTTQNWNVQSSDIIKTFSHNVDVVSPSFYVNDPTTKANQQVSSSVLKDHFPIYSHTKQHCSKDWRCWSVGRSVASPRWYELKYLNSQSMDCVDSRHLW